MTYTQPLIPLIVTIALIGMWRIRRCERSTIALLSLIGLVLISWPPVDWVMSRHLESPYSKRPFDAGGTLDAIVVLGSYVHPPSPNRPYPLPDKHNYHRCEHAAWLHSQYRVPVLACGGANQRNKQPVSHAMRQILERAGVPPAMIWVEERSRSTYENASFGAAILREKGARRIAVVTDARSMTRAAACFRKLGFAVATAPSEFRDLGSWSEEILPSWTSIEENETTLHETLGLVWYWLRGRI